MRGISVLQLEFSGFYLQQFKIVNFTNVNILFKLGKLFFASLRFISTGYLIFNNYSVSLFFVIYMFSGNMLFQNSERL